MAATGLYKLDDGNTFVSNCFPARGLFRPSVEGAGHWLVSHKAVQEKRFRAMVCSNSLGRQECTGNQCKDGSPARPQKTSVCPLRENEAGQHVLHGLFLLKSHYVESPSDLCSVDVSDKHLTSAKEEDFEDFDCVAYINAAENLLTLGNFRTFPALRELDISMNGIRNLTVSHRDFPHLEILDLSYNNLSPDDVLALGSLPRLRVLHLTGNGLSHLPSDMAVSELLKTEVKRFPSLEILMLDDNKLSNPSIFASLANLKRLKQLHLEKNGICEIPYLHQMEDAIHASSPTWVRVSTFGGESSLSLSSFHSVMKLNQPQSALDAPEEMHADGGKIDYVVSSHKEDPDRTEVVFTSLPNMPEDISLAKPASSERHFSFPDDFRAAAENSLSRLSPSFEPPLPELRYLNLADNKIAYEENLLAVALFPSLAELVIHGNPLTTLRSGDPPLLTNFLHDRLGINIIRKKSFEQGKPHIFIPVKAKRKVKTHIPKIPKKPLMLGAAPESFMLNLEFHSDMNEHADSQKQLHSPQISPDPLPPIRTSHMEESAVDGDVQEEATLSFERQREQWKAEHELEQENVDSVFMTQVEEMPDSPGEPVDEDDISEEAKETCTPIPDIFRGYEELYYVDPDPYFIEPVGVSCFGGYAPCDETRCLGP
ncbi:X-ray radiation resistance-associated protein 1 isoform X2 [Ambystoma mexicanum]|uniref:X-ray radiation resistance-associated protein 1 isoform X2 n=1 Tax=Ambystoma mexicanum TaxID=8296 RepID=UPI0037E99DAC